MKKPKWEPEAASAFLCNLTDEEATRRLTSTQYYPSHRALIKLASKIEDDPDHDGFISFACAAYGWMPTILDKWFPNHFNVTTPIETIRKLASPSAARAFLEGMEDTAPVNGSWVGTSKFLHFLNSSTFPIWDSRVAEHFGLRWAHQINKKSTYLRYFDFVHSEVSKDHSWLDAIVRHVETEHAYMASKVRCLELMLFERCP